MYGPSSFMVDDYTAEREREREREREGEREREREREREKFLYVFSHYKNFQKQHREKKYCMRKKN